jgi:hypothetical protein
MRNGNGIECSPAAMPADRLRIHLSTRSRQGKLTQTCVVCTLSIDRSGSIVRVSLGAMSTGADLQAFLSFLDAAFVSDAETTQSDAINISIPKLVKANVA